MMWQFKRNAAQFHAEAKQRHQQNVAEMQKRIAEGNFGPRRDTNPPTPSQPAKSPPPAPSSGFGFAPPDASPPQPGFAPPPASGGPPASPREAPAGFGVLPPAEGAKRLEEFKATGPQRFPPGSREIRDTTELKPGMEVWASAGPAWYRSTVVRVESRMMARVRLPASARMPERMLPAMQIRLPTDEPAATQR